MIVDEFIDRDLAGILVHISTDPWDVVRDGLNTRDPGVRARAEAVAAVLWATPGLDPKTTQKPAGAGTVLYPIRRGLIANLLQRSYAIACVQAHIWHDLPLVEIPPLAWFEALERGRVVDRPKPEAPFVEPSEELGFAPDQTIPVSLDAVRDLDGVDMARVTYVLRHRIRGAGTNVAASARASIGVLDRGARTHGRHLRSGSTEPDVPERERDHGPVRGGGGQRGPVDRDRGSVDPGVLAEPGSRA
jgi:hypothetical protein